MPMSERERRILDDIETALYIEDPHLDSVLSSAFDRRAFRRVAEPLIAAASGIAAVVLALALNIVLLGVIGFVLLVAAIAHGQRTIATNATNRAARKATGRAPRRWRLPRWPVT
jgi:hypothetical protein